MIFSLEVLFQPGYHISNKQKHPSTFSLEGSKQFLKWRHKLRQFKTESRGYDSGKGTENIQGSLAAGPGAIHSYLSGTTGVV